MVTSYDYWEQGDSNIIIDLPADYLDLKSPFQILRKKYSDHGRHGHPVKFMICERSLNVCEVGIKKTIFFKCVFSTYTYLEIFPLL